MTKKLRLCHRLSIPLGEQQYCYCQSYETLTAWLGSCRWASPMNQDTFATGIQRILSVRVIRMVLYVFNLMFVWGIWHCRLCLDVRTESHGLLSVLAPQTCYFSQVCDVRVVLEHCAETFLTYPGLTIEWFSIEMTRRLVNYFICSTYFCRSDIRKWSFDRLIFWNFTLHARFVCWGDIAPLVHVHKTAWI